MDEEENLEVSMEEIQSENWEETQMDIDVQYFTWFLSDWEQQRRMDAMWIVFLCGALALCIGASEFFMLCGQMP